MTKAGMALLLSPTYITLYNLAYPIASIMLLAFNFLNMLLRWVSIVLFDRWSNFSISLIVNPWAERRRTVFSASVSVILPVITHWFTLMSYSMISPVTTLWAVSFPVSLLRALKNYRYFHFIGVVRRHYRAFTRRSGYDVW